MVHPGHRWHGALRGRSRRRRTRLHLRCTRLRCHLRMIHAGHIAHRATSIGAERDAVCQLRFHLRESQLQIAHRGAQACRVVELPGFFHPGVHLVQRLRDGSSILRACPRTRRRLLRAGHVLVLRKGRTGRRHKRQRHDGNDCEPHDQTPRSGEGRTHTHVHRGHAHCRRPVTAGDSLPVRSREPVSRNPCNSSALRHASAAAST